MTSRELLKELRPAGPRRESEEKVAEREDGRERHAREKAAEMNRLLTAYFAGEDVPEDAFESHKGVKVPRLSQKRINRRASIIRKGWSEEEKAKRLIHPFRRVAWQLPEVAGTPAGFNPRLTGVGTFYNDDGFSR